MCPERLNRKAMHSNEATICRLFAVACDVTLCVNRINCAMHICSEPPRNHSKSFERICRRRLAMLSFELLG